MDSGRDRSSALAGVFLGARAPPESTILLTSTKCSGVGLAAGATRWAAMGGRLVGPGASDVVHVGLAGRTGLARAEGAGG